MYVEFTGPRMNAHNLRATLFFLAIVMVLVFFALTGMIASTEMLPSSVIFILLFFIGINLILCIKYGVRFALYLFLVVIPFQPFLTMPFATHLSLLELKMLVALKELILLLIFTFTIFQLVRLKLYLVDYLALLFLFVYFTALIKSGVGMVQLVSFREGFMLVLMYFIGRAIAFSGIGFMEIISAVFLLSTVIALFGFLERFIIGDWFWGMWGAVDYLNAKFEASRIYIQSYSGVPHNWYTYIGSEPIRRMSSTIGDAASFGRYIAFSVVAFLYFKPVRKIFLSKITWIIIGLALLLTLGRGGILIAVIGGGIWLLQYRKYWVVVVPLAVVGVMVLANTAMFDLSSANSIRHITGLVDGIAVIKSNLTGHGLGSSGQMALLYSEGGGKGSVSESYIGSLSYQLGLPGLAAYSIWLLYFIFSLIKRSRKAVYEESIGGNILLFVASLLLGVYITSFFANSAIAPISSSAIFIISGMVVSVYFHKDIKIVGNIKEVVWHPDLPPAGRAS